MRGNSTISNRCRCHRTAAVDHRTSCRWRPPYADKDMVPNAELIRRAEIVWIQANAISHAYYYKILDETRKHSIPVRFFSYASALKCAEQLAEQDMKEAQK